MSLGVWEGVAMIGWLCRCSKGGNQLRFVKSLLLTIQKVPQSLLNGADSPLGLGTFWVLVVGAGEAGNPTRCCVELEEQDQELGAG